jgi:hypothetical protein
MIWRLQIVQKLTGGTLTQPRDKSKAILVRHLFRSARGPEQLRARAHCAKRAMHAPFRRNRPASDRFGRLFPG